MLDLHHRHWKKPKTQTFSEIKEKRAQLRQKWAKYDWTEIVKSGIKGQGDGGESSRNAEEINEE